MPFFFRRKDFSISEVGNGNPKKQTIKVRNSNSFSVLLTIFGRFKGGDLNPGKRHSRDTRDDGTVMLCTLRAAIVLSRDCRADFGRPLPKKVMSHSRDGPGVTAPSRKDIVPLTGVWNPPPLPSPPLEKSPTNLRFLLFPADLRSKICSFLRPPNFGSVPTTPDPNTIFCLCKSIAIEMGGVSRYFSKVLGSGVDLTLPKICTRVVPEVQGDEILNFGREKCGGFPYLIPK